MKGKKSKEYMEVIAKKYGVTQGQVLEVIRSNYMFVYDNITPEENKLQEKFPTVPLLGFGKFFYGGFGRRTYNRMYKNTLIKKRLEKDESIST